MKQTRLKHNADGSLTVYVPRGQANLFKWVLSEGSAGLEIICSDGDTVQEAYKMNNINTRQEWRGFITD